MDEAERLRRLALAQAELALVRAEMRVLGEEAHVAAVEMLRDRDRWVSAGLDDLEDFANR